MIARANENWQRKRRHPKRSRRWNIKPELRDLAIKWLATIVTDPNARTTDVFRAMNLLLTAEAQNQKDEHRKKGRRRKRLNPMIFHFPSDHDDGPDSLMIAIDPTFDPPLA